MAVTVCGSGSESSDGESLPLERPLTAAAAAADLARVRSMPEMVEVLRFLAAFRAFLGLRQVISAAELEAALVACPGEGGLLERLHRDLLAGLSARGAAPPAHHPWASLLRGRLEAAGLEPLPFAPQRRRERREYAALPAESRVLALKALCDLRAEREDLRCALEAALGGGGKKAAAAAAEAAQRAGGAARPKRGASPTPPPLEAGEARGWEPLGLDSGGGRYYFLLAAPPCGGDIHDDPNGLLAERLYSGAALLASTRISAQAKGAINVIPPPPPAPKRAKSKGCGEAAPAGAAGGSEDGGGGGPAWAVLPAEEEGGEWRLVADGLDAIRAEAERLAGCRGRADRTLGCELLGRVVPLLEEARDAEERLARARQRVARTLGLGGGAREPARAAGEGGDGAPRGRRARAGVTYDFDSFDKQLKEAIRAHERVAVSDDEWCGCDLGARGLTYSEHQLAMLRRGRSGRPHDGAPPGGGALDVGALEREARKRRRAEEGASGGGGGSGSHGSEQEQEAEQRGGSGPPVSQQGPHHVEQQQEQQQAGADSGDLGQGSLG
ncbi:MAG: hypothetical protein J3K34DRAFT_476354 [Monoraphidium minutum]|nr:MAG: hypothetical protein J3K34DRAFT_476354 [Monoraphidium minutum]